MQMKKEKISIFKSNEKGITLIALIITIIVLIIVAGVAINMTIGENGIITRAKYAKEKEEIASLSEKLELQKANVRLDNNKSVTLDNYLEQLKLENIIEDIDIEETGEENSRYIEVEDKYIFSVTDLKNGDVKIEYEGKIGKLIPKIKGIEVTKVTTNSISVKVSAIRVDDGNYKYYIKNITNGEEYSLEQTSKSDEYTFTGLEQNKEYKIQVEVINKNGNALRETEGNIKTIPVQSLTSANINFTYTPNYWTNEKVTVSVSLKDGITIPEESKLQTSKDAKDWSNTTLQEFTENGYIYVRVWDGINGGGYAVGEVSKIDTDAPEISTPLSSKDVTTKGFTLSIGVTDGGSGLGKIIWYYKKSTDPTYISAEEKYTDLNGEDAGETSAITKTNPYNNLTSGTYNAYAEVYDVAGNKVASSTISVILGDVTGLNTSNIKFTYTPNYWTNGNVTVTAALNGISLKTGEKLQVSTDGTTYVDGSSKEYSANGTFYVRVSDGTNIGTAASAGVSKIDTDAPQISTALSSKDVTTKGFTLSIGVTDGGSGLGKIIWYYKKSTDTKYTSAEEKYTDINGENAGTTTATTKTKTYNNLTSGTYNAYAEVYDVAGTKTTSSTINITLGTVTALSTSNIKFTYSPSGWTNGNVTVTAALNGITLKTGEKLQVSTDGTTYVDGSSKEYSANGNFYVRVSDGTNIGTAASAEVSKIEKTKPTISSITGNFTIVNGNTGTITGSITDSGGSGVKGYYISTNSTTPTATSVTWTSGSNFSKSVTSAGTYYVWAIDNAGNISDRKSCTVSVQTAIAKVGSTYYSSVQNAINAGTTSTVVLLANTTEGITIANGKNITLNLNGKTLTTADITLNNGNNVGILINNGGTLNISNGTVMRTDYSNNSAIFVNYGTLNISSGTYTHNSSSGTDIWMSVMWTTPSGVTNITGGTFTTVSGGATICNNGTTTVKGGNIQGGKGIHNEKNLTVTGGTITGNTYHGITNIATGSVTIDGSSTKITGYYQGIYSEATNANITIKNGNIIGTVYDGIAVEGTETLTVSGGTITGQNRGISHNSTSTITINVTGGTIVGNVCDGIGQGGPGIINATGGTLKGGNWGIWSGGGGTVNCSSNVTLIGTCLINGRSLCVS